MKNKFLIIIYLLSLFIINGCHKEDDIIAEEKDLYMVPSNPQNEMEQYIYDFFINYNTVIYTAPDESNYRYNFAHANDIYVENADFDDELFSEAKDYLEYILSVYDEYFKKKYLPFSIQLVDKVCGFNYQTGEPLLDQLNNVMVSPNYIMIANINKDFFDNLTEEKLKEYAVEINTEFWIKNIFGYKGSFQFPDDFSSIPTKKNGKYESKITLISEDEAIHKMREIGYLTYSNMLYGFGGYFYTPYFNEDIISWLNLLFTKNESQIKEEFASYPIILKRYTLLRDAIKTSMNYTFNQF